MEAKHEYLSIQRVQMEESFGDLFPVFDARKMIKRARLVIGDLKGERLIVLVACLKKLIKARHRTLAAHVDHEVAGNGEEPRLKSRLAVELAAPRKNSHPDFLEEVVSSLPVPGQEEEVPHQPVLVADYEQVEQARVLTLKSFRYSKILLTDLFLRLGNTASGEQGSDSLNRTHLAQLDDKPEPEAAKKRDLH